MRKRLILILVLGLGIFFIPKSSFACHNHSPHAACCAQPEKTDQAEMQSCCNFQWNKNKMDCSGHQSCDCAMMSLVVPILPNKLKMPTTVRIADQAFLYDQTKIASGFYFIWLPPKLA